ncbi:Eisosome component PIL1-domain-containing protein [Sporodiniella umbellata]|nr:Eisosome component PIL1-domain-containing protein [Sporodiniella umbellata]
MFSFKPFHKSNEKSLSEKGLSGILEHTSKISKGIVQVADDNRIASNNLIMYGSPLGEDLTDVTGKMGNLLVEWSTVLMEFSDSIEQYRETLKSITAKESTLQQSRDQKRKMKEQIDKLSESALATDRMNALKEQLKELEEFTAPDEIEMDNFKRVATREALYLMLNGMFALSSKTDIISSFGKYIVDELNTDPIQPGEERPPYHGTAKTKRVQEDARNAIYNWKPDQGKLRRTLTSHHGHNPLIAKANKDLPPVPPNPDDLPDETVDMPEPTPVKTPNPMYKPDAVDLGVHHTFNSPGFVNGHNQPLNQQNLYQFYQNYLPPKSYEEMSRAFSPVFQEKRHDVGGFVLPSTNPNFMLNEPNEE